MPARALSLALALLLPASLALAADADGAFAVKGVGLNKCSEFVKVVQEKDNTGISLYVGWMSGFISASNQHMDETFDLTPWQNIRTLTAAMVNFCDKNADMRFGAAAVRLTAALAKDRLVDRSKLIPIEYEGRNHYVYEETLRRAQAALAELGLYTGNLDGVLNEDTRAAIEKFQTERELPVNGLPDQRTLFVLLRDES